MVRTASILMPARDEPIFTDEHTTSVDANASGMDAISRLSLSDMPFSTRAEYPPMKFTPTAFAASSSAWATNSCSREAINATGVTEIRLFTMGIPNSRSIFSHSDTRFSARRVIVSYTAVQVSFVADRMHPSREIPMVTVRISSRYFSIIAMVSRILPDE